MKQLRHFQVKCLDDVWGGWSVIEGCLRLEQTSNLQTLSRVKAENWMHGCLGKLTNLRKLGISLDCGGTYVEILYLELDGLQSLFVSSTYNLQKFPALLPLTHLFKLCKLHLHGELEKLPECNEFPTNITKLTLKYTSLEQDPLVKLEKLKKLRILRLLNGSYVETEMACSANRFPRLESLHFEWLLNLEEWRVEKGSMPRLLHLQIKARLRLKKLPEGLKFVTSLRKLELKNMQGEFKTRLEENDGEDWHKIQHIPSIDISKL